MRRTVIERHVTINLLVYQSGTVSYDLEQLHNSHDLFSNVEYDKGYNRRRARKCLQIIF